MKSKEERKEYEKQWRIANKEKRKEYDKRHYIKHKKECNERSRKYNKEHYDANKEELKQYQKEYRANDDNKIKIKEYLKKYHIKKHGITPEQRIEMFNMQEGKCKICGKHQSELKRQLLIDHNHITGKVRGLLCNNCNIMIGMSNDNSERLRIAADYLDKNNN